MGRRKILIEKISNKNYLQTAFSKRRNGLFKKASQFCRLSGAEIAVIVFSPGGRLYQFGLPSADSVIDRYTITEDGDNNNEEGNNEEGTREFPYSIIEDEEEDDAHDDDDDSSSEQSNEAADGNEELGKTRFWWDDLPIEDMELNQLEQYRSSLEVLRNELAHKLYDKKRRESHTKDYLSLIGSGISTEDMELSRQFESCSEVLTNEQLAYELYETKWRESETKDFLSLIGSSSRTGSSSTFYQVGEAQLRYLS